MVQINPSTGRKRNISRKFNSSTKYSNEELLKKYTNEIHSTGEEKDDIENIENIEQLEKKEETAFIINKDENWYDKEINVTLSGLKECKLNFFLLKN